MRSASRTLVRASLVLPARDRKPEDAVCSSGHERDVNPVWPGRSVLQNEATIVAHRRRAPSREDLHGGRTIARDLHGEATRGQLQIAHDCPTVRLERNIEPALVVRAHDSVRALQEIARYIDAVAVGLHA